jgi:hypothetical protein
MLAGYPVRVRAIAARPPAQAREADVEADVGDALVGLAQEEHRALDAPALQVV